MKGFAPTKLSQGSRERDEDISPGVSPQISALRLSPQKSKAAALQLSLVQSGTNNMQVEKASSQSKRPKKAITQVNDHMGIRDENELSNGSDYYEGPANPAQNME